MAEPSSLHHSFRGPPFRVFEFTWRERKWFDIVLVLRFGHPLTTPTTGKRFVRTATDTEVSSRIAPLCQLLSLTCEHYDNRRLLDVGDSVAALDIDELRIACFRFGEQLATTNRRIEDMTEFVEIHTATIIGYK